MPIRDLGSKRRLDNKPDRKLNLKMDPLLLILGFAGIAFTAKRRVAVITIEYSIFSLSYSGKLRRSISLNSGTTNTLYCRIYTSC
jgi:hypothetical protein